MAIEYISYLRKKIGHDRCLSVGLTSVIADEEGRILLEKRSDNGKYCLPGGSIDLDETVLEGARREVEEETGIRLEELRLFYIRSGKKNQLAYPNGDVTDYVDLVFSSEVNSHDIHLAIRDGESLSLGFYRKEELPDPFLFLRGTEDVLKVYFAHKDEVVID